MGRGEEKEEENKEKEEEEEEEEEKGKRLTQSCQQVTPVHQTILPHSFFSHLFFSCSSISHIAPPAPPDPPDPHDPPAPPASPAPSAPPAPSTQASCQYSCHYWASSLFMQMQIPVTSKIHPGIEDTTTRGGGAMDKKAETQNHVMI